VKRCISAFQPVLYLTKNEVTLALTGSWGSDKYMQTYYGVSAAQSAASGFARHDAGPGFMPGR
jgi:outer membrane scaffolding protein for murein synthesis (MipA/OmpV family)